MKLKLYHINSILDIFSWQFIPYSSSKENLRKNGFAVWYYLSETKALRPAGMLFVNWKDS